MSTSRETALYIEDLLAALDVHTAPMFGEYCVYVDGKVVAFITDDTVCIKPSSVDPALLAGTEPGEAYPGSKDYHRVPGDLLEDREWFVRVIQGTADALPTPAPRKPRRS